MTQNSHARPITDRRIVLKATAGLGAAVSLAGGSPIGSGGPAYADVESDTLFPGREILSGTGYEVSDVQTEGTAFESSDETQIVLMEANVFEDSDTLLPEKS